MAAWAATPGWYSRRRRRAPTISRRAVKRLTTRAPTPFRCPTPATAFPNRTGRTSPATTSTTGRVAVGGYVTGEIGPAAGDMDGFRVDLEEGVTYVIDLEGADTGRGTLSSSTIVVLSPTFLGVIDETSGPGNNVRVTFTATETGTHLVTVSSITTGGTYTLSVREQE